MKIKNQKLKIKNSKIQMADISEKTPTRREAIASAKISMKKQTLMRLKEGKIPKGDVLACAKIAGILAAKRTHELIPLCHPLSIDNVELSFKFNSRTSLITVTSNIISFGKTGVEMEALTAVTVASLTIYDMCKTIDRDITISDVKLLKKSGGKSGTYIKL